MAEVIRMPRMSDTMTEGVIVAWHKKVGDKIHPGDILAEVETDKATMELESYQEGTLLYIGVNKGDAVLVESIIAILGEKGEKFESLLKQEVEKVANEKKETEAAVTEIEKTTNPVKDIPVIKSAPISSGIAPQKSNPEEYSHGNGRLKASPLARKLAVEKGIDLRSVKGSGEEGRIIKRDIETYMLSETGKSQFIMPPFVEQESYSESNISQMRKTIARRLAESKFGAPHFYLTIDLNMDKMVDARASMNEISPLKISFNDIIIKASALALRQNPKINASWLGDKIRYNNHVHIGMAVAFDEGLIVPVIRFADIKSLATIATETKELGAKAKAKKLQPPEFEGNTFTISNLGMFDIEEFTAIINPPDSCIMAVGSIRKIPAVVDDQIKISNRMKVTLSCDHRVVDGATGAKFLQSFRQFIEDPVKLLAFSKII